MFGLSFHKRESAARPAVDLAGELDRCDRRREFLLLAARSLLQCIREFTLDLKDLDSREFRAALGELSEKLAAEEKLRRLESLFEARKLDIAAFAARQKTHVSEREREFKDIIDILGKAMVALDTENRRYNLSLLEQGRRIEDLTRLDDIKKLKQALLVEVESLQEAVRRKEARDTARIEELSKRVDVLHTELENVRSDSERDALTGVQNRRSFDRRLSEQVEKNTVAAQTLAVLMLDIDDFKRINDTHGHLTGDSVLVAVANKCRQAVRGEDVVARYGGEEFAILLPGATLRNAEKKARQICQAIASTRYLLEGVEPPQHLSLTVSIGVTALRKGDSVGSLMARADKALYQAKGSGKNRVCSA
jgi:diguanylate cyclase